MFCVKEPLLALWNQHRLFQLLCQPTSGESKRNGVEAMRKRAGTETNSVRTVQILSVSPSDADHAALREILQGAKPNLETNCRWMVHPVSTVASAAEALAQEEIPIVISDSDTWHAILQITSAVPEPPVLIVTSCSADEQLWAETLNLGAWDVLAKPFDADEVIRAGAPAWRRRQSALDRK